MLPPPPATPPSNRSSRTWLVVAVLAVLGLAVISNLRDGGGSKDTVASRAVAAVTGRPEPSPAPTSSPTSPAPRPSTTTRPSVLPPPVTAPPAPPPTTASDTGSGTGTGTGPVVVDVIDGDTIEVSGGLTIRLIGIDTPERGECGFGAASSALAAMVGGRSVVLVPGARDDADRYGRLLRYVEVGGVDANLAMISSGHAIARYDSLDGYGWHPRQQLYRSADAGTPPAGGCDPGSDSAGGAGGAAGAGGALGLVGPPQAPDGGVYFRNCTEARQAGAAPLRVGQPGYRPSMDRDRDGVACE
jgi:micrococcal nuclease